MLYVRFGHDSIGPVFVQNIQLYAYMCIWDLTPDPSLLYIMYEYITEVFFLLYFVFL
jgi:hypothetical protein